jgi:hypothetical protein
MFTTLREKLKGWKTIWINSVVGIPSTLYYLWMEFSGVDFTPLIPAKYVALFLVVNSVIGVILRIITTGPVGSKGDEKPAADVKAGD